MSFDLDAYFERIRLADRPACDLDGLATIQRAHRLAIPFENLDIRLGRGIAIDSEAVFDKLDAQVRTVGPAGIWAYALPPTTDPHRWEDTSALVASRSGC